MYPPLWFTCTLMRDTRFEILLLCSQTVGNSTGEVMEKYWIIGGGVLLGVLLIGSIVVSLSNDEDVFEPGTP